MFTVIRHSQEETVDKSRASANDLCTKCIYVQHVFMYNMYLCTTCIYIQRVFMYNMYICTTCIYVQHVFMYNMYLCTTCIYVQHVSCYGDSYTAAIFRCYHVQYHLTDGVVLPY